MDLIENNFKEFYPQKNKHRDIVAAVLIVIFIIICMVSCGRSNSSVSSNSNDKKSYGTEEKIEHVPSKEEILEPNDGDKKISDDNKTEELEEQTCTLKTKKFKIPAGQYIGGENIDTGKYNMKAISGTGNFSFKKKGEKYSDVSMMFGKNSSTRYYAEEYNGLRIENGDILEIKFDVIVEMTLNPKSLMENQSEKIKIPAGKYIGGVDIKTGKYNMEAVIGTGNFSFKKKGEKYSDVSMMFGKDSSTHYYAEQYNGLRIGKGDILEIKFDVIVEMSHISD